MIDLKNDLKNIPKPGQLCSKFSSPQLKYFQADKSKSKSDDDEREEESKEKLPKKYSKSFYLFFTTHNILLKKIQKFRKKFNLPKNILLSKIPKIRKKCNLPKVNKIVQSPIIFFSKENGEKPLCFDQYLNINMEENNTIREFSLKKSIQKILDEHRNERLQKLTKKNPFLLIVPKNKNTNEEDWFQIWNAPEPKPLSQKDLEWIENEIDEKFSNSIGDFNLTKMKEELEYVESEDVGNLIKNFKKNYKFFRRSTDYLSFYKAFGYGFLEKIMMDEYPFKKMLDLLKKIKKETFLLLNPFESNLENSNMNYFTMVKNHLEKTLREIAKKMIDNKDATDFKLKMAKHCQKIMKDKVFQLLLLTLMKSLVYEKCLLNKEGSNGIMKDVHMGFADVSNLKFVAEALNIKIKVFGYTTMKLKDETVAEEMGKSYGKNIENPDFAFNLYYCDGVYHLAYGDEFDSKILKKLAEN